MNEDQPDQDIWDVFAEERSRGTKRGPLHAQERRRRIDFQGAVLKAIREKDERAFTGLLRRAGMRDESPEFAAVLKRFRAHCGLSSP